MTLTEYPDLVQGSDEWLEARRGLVTASVVGKLITTRARGPLEYPCQLCDSSPGEACVSVAKGAKGEAIKTVHPNRAAAAREDTSPPPLEVSNGDDARALMASLAAERISGHIDPVYVSNDMVRGQMDEPIARDVYAEHFAPVRELGFIVRTEPTWRLGYSPDGLVGDDGLIEIKSRRQKKQLTTVLSGQVPGENMAQLQAGLLVTGRSWIDYVSYCGGLHLYVKRVYPDPRWFAAIVSAVERFEQTAAEMVARYEMATVGLPLTERLDDLEMSL